MRHYLVRRVATRFKIRSGTVAEESNGESSQDRDIGRVGSGFARPRICQLAIQPAGAPALPCALPRARFKLGQPFTATSRQLARAPARTVSDPSRPRDLDVLIRLTYKRAVHIVLPADPESTPSMTGTILNSSPSGKCQVSCGDRATWRRPTLSEKRGEEDAATWHNPINRWEGAAVGGRQGRVGGGPHTGSKKDPRRKAGVGSLKSRQENAPKLPQTSSHF